VMMQIHPNMALFSKQISFIDNIQNEILKVFKQSLKRFDFVVIDYVTNKQLFQKGIDGSGKKLEGYTRLTIRYKLQKGQPVDRTTLRDTGAFYHSFKIDIFPDSFRISSNVVYDKYLTKKYGKNILKPTNKKMNEFIRHYVMPDIKKRINEQFAK